ncbi:hypothetical protein, partial [Arcanobacterium haemolyticum]|uniref:hypothetical protein n=1 Tax=Arcanobacterium haemolyticum TaxID=28264 RepID=UPI001CC1D0DE
DYFENSGKYCHYSRNNQHRQTVTTIKSALDFKIRHYTVEQTTPPKSQHHASKPNVIAQRHQKFP